MKIVVPAINDLKIIDKIAVQVHECHVNWRPDIFKHTKSIMNEEKLSNLIKNNEIFVAIINKEIVGYVIISSREMKMEGYIYRKQIKIEAIGVDENYRNQGVGSKLLEFMKEYARENNYTDIKLTVNEENESAKHLYEKVGFKVENIAYSMPIK